MRGGHQVGGPLLKRLLSRIAGLTLHWFGGVPTHDPTNNFKLYSRRFLDADDDREQRGLRARPRAHGQGDARRAAAWRRCRRPGGTGRRARATSSSASGCPTTSTGTGWRCAAASGGRAPADRQAGTAPGSTDSTGARWSSTRSASASNRNRVAASQAATYSPADDEQQRLVAGQERRCTRARRRPSPRAG